MIKNIFLVIVIILVSNTLSAQKDSSLVKSPHQISIEAGYRNVFSVIDHSSTSPYTNVASQGFGAMLDYGWKVSGLNGKKPAVFLTVPLGYNVMYASNSTSKNVTMLSYGWTVRHELAKKTVQIIPFVGYGLLLNTLKIEGREGGVMGHQTQFELGTNFNTSTRLKYFAKVAYSYSSYPKLDDSKRIHFQYFDVKCGVRF